ncbi:SDR family oxidoreductase [Desulfosediminicola flagellatus]|uniref:SDR family oxidoreductase n=1 Tax=Desulfosediminicola flagellatus TaxID=2569541 RepID=UPI001592C9F5|nr:SDR family oxidoreductase [Desulfosediminicola flagellatus]
MANSDTPLKVLVTGATGYIGRRLVERLLTDSTIAIRVLVRNKNKLQAAVTDKVEIVEGDTFDEECLKLALEGVDTAFYLIHSMGSDKDYQDLDRKSADNFRRACIAAGARRIVYLGGLGVKESASKHLMSRIETGEILSEEPDKIQTIWLRAGVIIGSGSASFEIIRNLVQKLPAMITPKWVKTLTQPVGIEDVLSYLAACIRLKEDADQIVDIGAETLSFKDMMRQASEVMGLRRYLIPVPVLSPRLSSYWLILFTPVPVKLAAALVEGLKSETTLQNDNARRLFPEIEPASYRKSVEYAIEELEQNQVVSRWCDSSGNTACDIKDYDNPAGAILRDIREVELNNISPESVFSSVCSLGGDQGWYRYTILWRARGFIDKIFGGFGLNRGRRMNGEVRIGDALDFWKVADVKTNKRLLLYAQMKIPGKAWLEFDIHEDKLIQTAHFLPRGVWGRLYWYSVLPLHYFVFRDLAKKIVLHAKEI